ncbi:MAG: uracil-DNA glycosylase [Nitriliruptorales bacterium]
MTGATLRPWNDLASAAAVCTRCALHETRSRAVFGDGDPDADLVFVGDAPGRHEELTGKPFEGAAGNLLDNLLLENDLARRDVYVLNLVKCRPPDHREPTDDEIDSCFPYLREQLAHVQPRVVVALGERVTSLLLGRHAPIAKIAGYRIPRAGATLIPTYHLADALRGSPTAMAALKRDVRTAKGVLDGRVPPAERGLVGDEPSGAGRS